MNEFSGIRIVSLKFRLSPGKRHALGTIRSIGNFGLRARRHPAGHLVPEAKTRDRGEVLVEGHEDRTRFQGVGGDPDIFDEEAGSAPRGETKPGS